MRLAAVLDLDLNVRMLLRKTAEEAADGLGVLTVRWDSVLAHARFMQS